jgi:transcriptional regulator with XRE-family HTH domain
MTDWREVIFTIKRKHGISQSEIARRVGVTPSAVNGWINLGNTPYRENREKLLNMAGEGA